jgi:hypothetical protein
MIQVSKETVRSTSLHLAVLALVGFGHIESAPASGRANHHRV